MLVISRRIGEALIAGDNDIEFKILEITGQQVRIGITADRSIPIHRDEIYHKIKDEGREVTSVASILPAT